MPEVLDKEAIEFLTRFLGGTACVAEEYVFEWYVHQHPELFGKFPYNRPNEKLPYWYDILVGGISIAEALAGLGIEEDPMKVLEGMDIKTKEGLKEFGKGLRKFGEGGVLYSVPMLTRTTIIQNVPPGTVAAGNPGQTSPPAAQGRVIKL